MNTAPDNSAAPQAPGSSARKALKETLVGTILNNRYYIEGIAGFGSVSIVYKARNRDNDKLVAIKTLKSECLTKTEIVQRFEREARALRKLNHPNVVAVLDCFVEDGQTFLVTDFLIGMNLEDLIKDEGYLAVDLAQPIFLQICAGLKHAHKHGIIHRDLKPENIQLLAESTGAELVKLVDFGLAKVDEEVVRLTQQGQACGSPAYMSPEQCTGKPIDRRSDIYSFGIVMYETVTGKLPFQTGIMMETMRKQTYEEPPSFAAIRPDLELPTEVERVVMKALRKAPEDRYQTIDEVMAAVKSWKLKPGTSLKVINKPHDPSDGWLHSESEQRISSPKKSFKTTREFQSRLPSDFTHHAGSEEEDGPPKQRTAHDPEGGVHVQKIRAWKERQRRWQSMQVPLICAAFIVLMFAACAVTYMISQQGDTSAATLTPAIDRSTATAPATRSSSNADPSSASTTLSTSSTSSRSSAAGTEMPPDTVKGAQSSGPIPGITIPGITPAGAGTNRSERAPQVSTTTSVAGDSSERSSGTERNPAIESRAAELGTKSGASAANPLLSTEPESTQPVSTPSATARAKKAVRRHRPVKRAPAVQVEERPRTRRAYQTYSY